ncbi:hypothetical protein VFPFJ_00278 [Purpureocillium lilacinum]|uniref:Uncharacterized protein n=1 Tax=Purpureocillium lilacinum TaxID=33203 RepID=A0A179H7V4_PURLI|nr:hypothetical protein VFPFJ_00278 [Purpureocillium lilacinum]OAQ86207.1 hypothetical protein VFPBJ_00247 [Purpureocillium lilacinum]OAQ94169.1 hypothetical protein VFPFJ_00278 [Purpureocillium lilacinum]
MPGTRALGESTPAAQVPQEVPRYLVGHCKPHQTPSNFNTAIVPSHRRCTAPGQQPQRHNAAATAFGATKSRRYAAEDEEAAHSARVCWALHQDLHHHLHRACEPTSAVLRCSLS